MTTDRKLDLSDILRAVRAVQQSSSWWEDGSIRQVVEEWLPKLVVDALTDPLATELRDAAKQKS